MFWSRPRGDASTSSTPPTVKEFTLRARLYVNSELLEDVSVKLLDRRLDNLLIDSTQELRFSVSEESAVQPMAVLSTFGSSIRACLMLEAVSGSRGWSNVYEMCLTHKKYQSIAMVLEDREQEVRLIAMKSKKNPSLICFWGFLIPRGHYESSLAMFEQQFLRVVLGLDGLFVRSYYEEDFMKIIEELQQQRPNQPLLQDKIKIYQEDLALLQEYKTSNNVVIDGRSYEADEDGIIRLEGGRVFTRADPSNPHTSVLVWVRPSWESIKARLASIASKRPRRRYEVYVCAGISQRLALKVWRILDPKSSLIEADDQSNHIVSVGRGAKKNLLDVFHKINCDEKMAMVIDYTSERWGEGDKSRVHLVPRFDPYAAPEEESAFAVAVCVAEEVRASLFMDFCQHVNQIRAITYEADNEKGLPTLPDMARRLAEAENKSKKSSKKRLPQMMMSWGNACLNTSDVHTSPRVQYRSGVDSPRTFDRMLTNMSMDVTSSNLQAEVSDSALATALSPSAVIASCNYSQPSRRQDSTTTSARTLGDMSRPVTPSSLQAEASGSAPATASSPSAVIDSVVSPFQRFLNSVSQKLAAGTPIIPVPVDAAVFGRSIDFYLGLEDVRCVCCMQDLSDNCVAMFIRHLHDTLKMKGMEHKYEFVNPESVSAATGAKLSRIIASRLKNCTNCEWVFAPFRPEGGAWLLVAINMAGMQCYWLDPSERPNLPNIKPYFHFGLKGLQKDGGRSVPPGYNTTCPKQQNSNESGLYVMKFLSSLIDEPNILTESQPFPKPTYDQVEIDEVRLEWLKAVEAYVQ